MQKPAPGVRSRVRRQRKRAAYDTDAVHRVFDASLLCHVGFAVDGQPFVIPMLYARDGERLLLHGAGASRLMRQLSGGCEACVAVTVLDGVVLARSAFHSSANYRSVVAFGRAKPLKAAAKRRALDRLVETLIPGRTAEVRPPDRAELAATSVLEFVIEEASVKIRTGPPSDPPADLALPIWAGVIPLDATAGRPQPDQQSTQLPLPASVVGWRPPGDPRSGV